MKSRASIYDLLPPRPGLEPLDWHSLAAAFDAFVMNPDNRIRYTTKSGHHAFSAFMESSRYGTDSHELVTFGPVVLGKLLRGDDVVALAQGLSSFFDQARGIFLNSPGVTRIEMWYLVYANALAAHLARRLTGQMPELAVQWRQSAEMLRQMAHRIHYDFNWQGYDFGEQMPWTAEDIYRQPDSIGGYAYLMLLAFEMFGDRSFLEESRTALTKYLQFADNPWYEVPNGSLALAAAARLCALGHQVDTSRAFALLMDPAASLVVGTWAGCEVNGLMRGWRYSTPESAYSMESLVVLPNILPAARYDVRLADAIGRYALHVAANARYFFSEFMRGQESRPDLSPAVPYERLLAENEGRAPYATGDFEGHRSVYGGAYTLWWDALVRPTEDPFILRLDLTRSDFLSERAYPTFLYYNPWDVERSVTIEMGEEAHDIYGLKQHSWLARSEARTTVLTLPPMEAQVIVLCPAGASPLAQQQVLLVDDIAVDFAVER
jgi:hypothetical protein